MSARLTFHQAEGGLVIKFDGKPVPEEKHEDILKLLESDMERRVKQLHNTPEKP